MNFELKQVIHEIAIRNLPVNEKSAIEKFFNQHGCRERGGFYFRLLRDKLHNTVGYLTMVILDENEWFIEKFNDMPYGIHRLAVSIERMAYVRIPGRIRTLPPAQTQAPNVVINIYTQTNAQSTNTERLPSRLATFFANNQARIENMVTQLASEARRIGQSHLKDNA